MKILLILILGFNLVACSLSSNDPVRRNQNIDLHRFMGKWYVVANIPTFLEKDAFNATETYAMNPDGSIATTFTFNDGSFDGERKTYHPVGYVSEDDNSLWGMQFIWPFKSEFIIAYVSDDYQQTIIARTERDYLWIMARTPAIEQSQYAKLVSIASDIGYDISKIQRVPQDWNPKH